MALADGAVVDPEGEVEEGAVEMMEEAVELVGGWDGGVPLCSELGGGGGGLLTFVMSLVWEKYAIFPSLRACLSSGS